ncbi:MAG: hypothetical protein ACE5JQ_00270 [Candidatus Methylomirabilales bacterium]
MAVWLADISDERGISGYYQVEELSTRLSHAVVEKMTLTTAFARLSEIVGYHPARTFLLVRCKAYIRPLACACVVGGSLPVGDPQLEDKVTMSDPLLYSLLKEIWPSSRVHLNVKPGWRDVGILRARVRSWIQNSLQAIPSAKAAMSSDINIAIGVECNQLEISRGVILGWLTRLPPERTILCLGHSGKPINQSTLSDIEKRGFHWISLARDTMVGNPSYWRPGPFRRMTAAKYWHAVRGLREEDALERWVMGAAASLLHRVDYWRTFFSRHKIRLYVIYSVEPEDNIAKRIAIALEGGVLVFLQRSHLADRGVGLGRRPAHVLFCWGDPEAAVGRDNENHNEYFVITGFNGENDFPEGKIQALKYRERLTQAGARFVIALFDNGYGHDMVFSRTTLVSLYHYFLTWVLASKDGGLIIKPKRDTIPRGLSELRDLFAAAEATGRCLVLTGEAGAHTAGFAADLGVGLGHSSAAVVSAIAVGRALHCDLGRTPDHPLASWGMGRVLFHDLESLARAIESYRKEPARSPVGDFTPVLDDLDPFRDGRAGERTENYLRWLLEAFDEGHGRDAAIREANMRYATKWGVDKVLFFQDGRGLAPAVSDLDVVRRL